MSSAHGTGAAKPRGREEIIRAVVAATHRILATAGPIKLTLRAVAAEANVNIGLIHRHVGSRADVLRAAADQMGVASEERIRGAPDLPTAITTMFTSDGEFVHGIAWSILQDEMDSVLPDTFPSLDRLRMLAAEQDGDERRDDRIVTTAKVASLTAMVLGWKLYEPYLTRGLHIDAAERAEIEAGMLAVLDAVARSSPAPTERLDG